MEKNLEIKVYGKVQGVGFRFCSHLAFVDLEVKGTAENGLENNLVIKVQGPEEKLERLVKWCHKGPEGARVEKVEVTELPLEIVVEK